MTSLSLSPFAFPLLHTHPALVEQREREILSMSLRRSRWAWKKLSSTSFLRPLHRKRPHLHSPCHKLWPSLRAMTTVKHYPHAQRYVHGISSLETFWKLTSVHFPSRQATISALGLQDSLLRFDVSAPLVVSQTGGSVEAGLGDLISNAIGIANDLYLADLPAILDGILARNVTSLINTAARSWLETAAGVRADNPDLCDKGASSPDAITGELICSWTRTLQGNASTLTRCLQTP